MLFYDRVFLPGLFFFTVRNKHLSPKCIRLLKSECLVDNVWYLFMSLIMLDSSRQAKKQMDKRLRAIQQGVSCPSVKHGQLEPFEMTANYLIKSRKTTLLSWYAKLGDAYLSKFSKKDSLRPIRSDLNALFRKILEILMNLSFAKDFLIFRKDSSGP